MRSKVLGSPGYEDPVCTRLVFMVTLGMQPLRTSLPVVKPAWTKAYEGGTVSTQSNDSDKPTLCHHFLKVSLHEKKLRHKALSLLMAWLTLQVVTAALWSDRHQNYDEGPRGWAGVRTGVCVRAEGRVGPRNLKIGDAHTHSEGWIRRNWWKSKHALCVLTPRESHRGNPQCWRDKLCNSVQNLLLF